MKVLKPKKYGRHYHIQGPYGKVLCGSRIHNPEQYTIVEMAFWHWWMLGWRCYHCEKYYYRLKEEEKARVEEGG